MMSGIRGAESKAESSSFESTSVSLSLSMLTRYSVLPPFFFFLDFYRIGIVYRAHGTGMVGVLGQFLLPEFEFPLVEVFELAVREREKLEPLGPFVEVEDVECVAVAVFEAAAEAAAPDFLGQFVVPLCLASATAALR